MLPPDLDTSLPAAAKAVAPAEVMRAFERLWSGDGPAPKVTGCNQDYLRWWPGEELVATFSLSLDAHSTPPGSTVLSVLVRPDGVRYASLRDDPELPGLAYATDPHAVAEMLRDALRDDVQIRAIEPVRYRPGRRCVLRYQLESETDATVLYGKVLPPGEAASLAATLAALGEGLTPAVRATALRWGLIVQADTGGSSLSRVGKGPSSAVDLPDVTAAAALLARLHGGGYPTAPQRTLHDDARDLLQFVPACERFAPAAAAQLREAARSASALLAGAAPVPSHGAFRLDQVHTGSGGPVLIDIDSYCVAERERDLGNLFAYLEWRAIRRPESRDALDAVRTTFLRSYEDAAATRVDPDRLRAYHGVSLLKIAGRRYPRLKTGEWDRVPALVDSAVALLRPSAVAS